MSDQIESNNNSDHDTILSEMERRIIQRIDDRASAKDKTTFAHVNVICKAMELMGERMEARCDGIEQSMQTKFSEINCFIVELREIVERLYSESKQIRKYMLQRTLWLVGTIIASTGVAFAAVTFLSCNCGEIPK